MDEVLAKCPDLSRLTKLLEDISHSLHVTKDTVRDSCEMSKALLRCWHLPSNEEQPVCLCSSVPHQKMQTLLQKVEQAVNYTRSLREGRSDVPIPWEDSTECDKPNSPSQEKKVVSRTGLKPAVPRSKVLARPLASVNGSINRKSRHSGGSREKEDSQNCDINIVNIDCPLHSSNSPREPAVRQVGLAEALDVKGIPPELVTIFKSFHRYVDHHRGVRKKSKSAASFLRRAATLNEDAATTLEPLHEFADHFKSNRPALRPLDDWATEESNFPASGLWHPSVNELFSGSPLVLRYRNRESLKELHSTLQSLQLSELQLQVSEILLNEVVPRLLKLSSSDPVLPLYLKTLTALSAMPPWCMPALVRTTRPRAPVRSQLTCASKLSFLPYKL